MKTGTMKRTLAGVMAAFAMMAVVALPGTATMGSVSEPTSIVASISGGSLTASAAGRDADSYNSLTAAIASGEVDGFSVSANTYPKTGGGYLSYDQIVSKEDDDKGMVISAQYNLLTNAGKKAVLEDMITISEKKISYDVKNADDGIAVTQQTQTDWMNALQQCDGVGTQLMNSLLKNTKPDYATANKIYEPFSGVVGTAMGLGAIIIMAFLGLTMVLDLCYIGIPAFRLFLNGEEGGQGGGPGGGGQRGGKMKLISHEAISAVQQAEGGQGGAGQQGGENKIAVGLYFKKRVFMLVLLGICLLYLIQGQIFTLVSYILDLLSGFIGF